MRLYGKIAKLVANMFTKQTSAPSLDTGDSCVYVFDDGAGNIDLKYRRDDATVETEQFVALRDTKTTLATDTLSEVTAGAGVTVDGVLIKDGLVDGVDVSAHAAATAAHGTSGTVVGTSDAQTLTSKFLDGGTANTTNKWKIPQDTLANIQSLTATEGLLVYATDVDTVYVGDGTNWVAVGSGTGQGEKNYITNPSAASSTTGWVASSVNLTIARTTTAAQCPREFTTKTAISLTSSTDEAYARFRFSLDDSDLSKKLKIALSFINADTSDAWRIEMWQNSTAAYDGTYTELSLSTDSSGDSYLPVTTGDFKSTFDATTTPYMELRVVHNTTNSDILYLSDVIVGPGSVIQGAAVQGPHTYTPTFAGFGTAASPLFSYTRVGSKLIVEGRFSAGTVSTDEARIYLPTGLTISTPSSSMFIQGRWERVAAVATTVKNGPLQVVGGLTYVTFGMDDYTNGASPIVKYQGGQLFNTGELLLVTFECDIAEWAGSGTVNLAQNDVEYAASTTGTWNADAAATNTIYGPAGAPISGALSTYRTKVVRFQTPIQSTDNIIVEVSDDGIYWVDSSRAIYRGGLIIPSLYSSGTTWSGIHVNKVAGNSTDIAVTFGAYMSIANDDAPVADWIAGGYWRVRKTSAGAAVGFGIVQPGTSAGLVSANGLPGRIDGGTVESGYVGEVKTASAIIASTTAGSGTPTNATNELSLGVGNWLLFYTGSAGLGADPAPDKGIKLDFTIYNASDATTLGSCAAAAYVYKLAGGTISPSSSWTGSCGIVTTIRIRNGTKSIYGRIGNTLVSADTTGYWTSTDNGGLVAVRIA